MSSYPTIKKMRRWLLACSLLLSLQAAAQGRLIINGGVVAIANGANLVIDNPATDAITRLGSGYIKTEGAANNIIWKIGAGNGNTYLVPFGNAAAYLPLQFNASAGLGASGRFILSTYPTLSWKNSDALPPGVSNVNSAGIDNSAKTIDRFWQVNPQGYTTRPSLSNLVFTYATGEILSPNTITESRLIAQRWNTVKNSWGDYIPPAVVNTIAKTVTVAAVAGDQLYNWWTLVDANAALPVSLINFKASAGNKMVFTFWQTLIEQNSDHFEVWRSKDGQQFAYAGSVPAAGNSSGISNYAFTDSMSFTGISYYRLKSVDRNGLFSWSAIVIVNMNTNTGFSVSPNPAHDFIIISSNSQLLGTHPVARLYDAGARLLQEFTIGTGRQTLNISRLPAGIYQLHISYNSYQQTLRFIKN
jgi:Secretion system C-terminal sorting domain